MSDGSIPEQVRAAMKAAMKAREKERLAAIRLIQAEFKRIEVDERIDIDDARALSILDKMVKQRRDSQAQYEEAGRAELAAQEAAEIDVIAEFLPTPLTDAELEQLVDAAIAAQGAAGMQAMGAVMGELKPKLAGRADMGAVSKLVKARLSG
ncbi:GatB/YqeY domain-containing protein [Pseudohaliea rubra]|uniref:Transamidase GatB domain protein n=1 Tax=Pseudohaliea rubra DSM 19751 TaxID=1265313 RepID=A0A095VRW6_9GAMM|nr:GatB/YqeY domain-containing protein [Pseudohaliea rubra]KGE03848.1 Transamidase GatB domain protein [Pseudohaliea rubra DSM 19751]